VTEFRCTINQAPLGKGRPRATVRNGRARVYTPAASADWEHYAALELGSRYRAAYPVEPANFMPGALGLELVAVFARTKALATMNTKGIYKHGPVRFPHAQKPDLDNVLKAVCDALEKAGVLEDDKQIAVHHASKVWAAAGEAPAVHVRLWVLP
jgi:Holliday junction resolvase RusA-like endonuclease